MNATNLDTPRPVSSPRQRGWWRLGGVAFAAILSIYLVIAYVVAPLFWIEYARRHPALDATPGVTLTGDDHPGDPINVALIGEIDEVKEILKAAGWFPADPLGVRSDLEIAADTVLKKEYDQAPVSKLYLWGRVEDLAYQQPVGGNPRQRHHVRFWKSATPGGQGRPLWVGAVSYDKSVGLSHTTGQITHHIAADVDAERDHLFESLKKTGQLAGSLYIDDFHKVREGNNGGGDPWRTDGRLWQGTIAITGRTSPNPQAE